MKGKYLLLLAIVLSSVATAFLPSTEAVSPAPDGCYPNFTTAEGCDALNSLGSGSGNTGLGWRSLFSDSTAQLQYRSGGWSAGASTTRITTPPLAQRRFCLTPAVEETQPLEQVRWFITTPASAHSALGAFALFDNTAGSQNTAVR